MSMRALVEGTAYSSMCIAAGDIKCWVGIPGLHTDVMGGVHEAERAPDSAEPMHGWSVRCRRCAVSPLYVFKPGEGISSNPLFQVKPSLVSVMQGRYNESSSSFPSITISLLHPHVASARIVAILI